MGDNATRVLTNGGGSSELKVKDYISPLDAITAVFGADNVDYARGYAAGPPMYDRDEPVPAAVQDSLRAEAVARAAKADVVVYVGGLNKNAFQDCEGQDRTSYGLPFGQDALIEALVKANPNVVIANISGNAYAMPWADSVPAILHTSYLGTMGGASIVDVLAGRVNPSGKLPYSIPVRLEDCAAHSFGTDSYPGVESESGDVLFGVCAPQQRYEEDVLVGYRWHDTKKVPARYAFGHGLSYTSFAYGKPVLSAKVGDDKASVLRPVKELKGFEKVTLAPGETRDVTFTVTPEMLAFFDADAHAWRTEPGTFTLYLGGSSALTPAKAKFKLL